MKYISLTKNNFLQPLDLIFGTPTKINTKTSTVSPNTQEVSGWAESISLAHDYIYNSDNTLNELNFKSNNIYYISDVNVINDTDVLDYINQQTKEDYKCLLGPFHLIFNNFRYIYDLKYNKNSFEDSFNKLKTFNINFNDFNFINFYQNNLDIVLNCNFNSMVEYSTKKFAVLPYYIYLSNYYLSKGICIYDDKEKCLEFLKKVDECYVWISSLKNMSVYTSNKISEYIINHHLLAVQDIALKYNNQVINAKNTYNEYVWGEYPIDVVKQLKENNYDASSLEIKDFKYGYIPLAKVLNCLDSSVFNNTAISSLFKPSFLERIKI